MQMRYRHTIPVVIAMTSLLLAAGCGEEGASGPDDDGMTDVGDVEPDGASPDVIDDVDPGLDSGDIGEDVVEPDADVADPDGGEDEDTWGQRDPDSDGLTNAQEADLCGGDGSDPHDSDTDDDNLSDYEEWNAGTNPCKADTDGDGASDYEEVEKWSDLNPNKPVTYNDGVQDGDRWILSACEGVDSNKILFEENSPGNWKIALPTGFSNYSNVTITGTQSPTAAAVYDNPTTEIGALTASSENPQAMIDPVAPFRSGGNVRQALNAVGDVSSGNVFVRGEFETHDGYRAATGEFPLKVAGDGASIRKVRQQLLYELFPGQSAGSFSGLPGTAGTKYNEFQVISTAIYRPNPQTSGDAQRLITVALAPQQKYNSQTKIKFQMDDLINATNIAEEVDEPESVCRKYSAIKDRPPVEFYWVLDQSVSMTPPLNEAVVNFSNQLVAEIDNTALDYRMGVTNMDPRNQGRFRIPPAWHDQENIFKSEVQDAVVSCSGGANWNCSSGEEYGLQVAREGIRYMTGAGSQQPTAPEEIRSEANVITIFMSDEEANSVKFDDYPPGITSIDEYVDWFDGRTTAFSVTGRSDCEQNGVAYASVAQGTGGTSASICSNKLTDTITRIINAANEKASNYRPTPQPISSSLKVYLNGDWVPRSTEDGYTYSARDNSVSFFGDFRPDPDKYDDPNVEPDRIAIIYDRYIDKCKEEGYGAQNCR